jgi:hypothetical protein
MADEFRGLFPNAEVVGLGGATEAQVRITWPDGRTDVWVTVGADQVVELDRGAAAPIVRQAPPG